MILSIYLKFLLTVMIKYRKKVWLRGKIIIQSEKIELLKCNEI